MLNLLKTGYRRQLFFPGFLGIFSNPFFIARKGLADAIAEWAPQLQGKLLDVGCGTKPYRSLFRVETYVGLEVDGRDARLRGCADHYYDGTTFPFEQDSFDSILCNQVLEHVFNPDEFVEQLVGVLKPGGRLLLTVPFVWDEHEQPFDYARYSSFGLRALVERHGLTVRQQKKLGADASMLFQLANAYLFKISRRAPRSVRILLTVSVMALMNLAGILAGRLLPKNPDLYLDQIILAEKTI